MRAARVLSALQADPFGHFVNDNVQRSTRRESLRFVRAKHRFHHDLAKLHGSRDALSLRAKRRTKLLAAGALVAAFFAGDAESAA